MSSSPRPPRLPAVDLLRGAVMVVMALDHCRDYYAPTDFAVEDLTRTTAVWFVTRWVTHFCAPVFVLLAGTGAYLHAERRRLEPGELSRFLLTRGTWLIVLELTVLHFVWWLTPDRDWLASPYAVVYGQIIWAIGFSMVALAGLVRLPRPAVAAFGVAMIAGHDLLRGWSFEERVLATPPAELDLGQKLWSVLHVQTWFPLAGGCTFGVVYPLIPWIGVMAAGYALGPVMSREPASRRRLLLALGCGLTAAFLVLRGGNLYGDPVPWSRQPGALFTVFSFVNCEKYPASLCFLLMTLGPALVALAVLDRLRGPAARLLEVFGRAPLFFYVVHLAVINAGAGLYFLLRYGQPRWGAAMYHDFPLAYVPSPMVVYAAWVAVVVVMFPACRRFGEIRRAGGWWTSYF